MNVSEDDVARRQAEEDLQLYGGRPQPSDAIDIDNFGEQAKMRPKRNLSEVEAADDRVVKVRKIEEPGSDAHPHVTAMDWNSGASPLDSWLNQSAIPSLMPTTNQEPPRPSANDLIAREEEQIRAFRTVHITSVTEAADLIGKHTVDENFAGLTLGAQIYYPNIKDRYPDIPPFLAQRLAKANLGRAKRLQNERRSRTKMLKQPDIRGRSNFEGFWLGGRPARRPSSADSLHSRSSSMNSSLRGSQSIVSIQSLDTTSDQEKNLPRGLPPPPVNISKAQAFDCDICGGNVQVKRRRDWQ